MPAISVRAAAISHNIKISHHLRWAYLREQPGHLPQRPRLPQVAHRGLAREPGAPKREASPCLPTCKIWVYVSEVAYRGILAGQPLWATQTPATRCPRKAGRCPNAGRFLKPLRALRPPGNGGNVGNMGKASSTQPLKDGAMP